MIVGEQKPIQEILRMMEPYDRILVAGCGSCVTVCLAGGQKEVGILASVLRIARAKEGRPLEVAEGTVERQCEEEFIQTLEDTMEGAEAVVSIACGIGVQTLTDVFPQKKIYPGLNTTFMGMPLEQGVWAERCQACGNCLLDVTGGICPISRCAKSLFNGPCGGSQDGQCEVNAEIECAWQLIYDRLKALGELDRLEEVMLERDWSTNRNGGPRKVIREDLRL